MATKKTKKFGNGGAAKKPFPAMRGRSLTIPLDEPKPAARRGSAPTAAERAASRKQDESLKKAKVTKREAKVIGSANRSEGPGYKKGGKVKKYATGGIGASLGNSLSKMGMTNAAKPVARQSQGNVRKPMAQGQALQGQALRQYMMGVNPGKPATRPNMPGGPKPQGDVRKPMAQGQALQGQALRKYMMADLNPDDIKQVRAAMGVSAPSAQSRAQSGYDNYMNQMRMGVSTGNYDPTPYGDPAWQKANKIRVEKPLVSAPALTPRPSPTSNVMVGSGMVAQPAPAPGYKKGGKIMKKSDKAGRALVKKSADTMGRAMVKKNKGGSCYAKGGSVSSASKRADGCAIKGKTKGKMLARGGKC